MGYGREEALPFRDHEPLSSAVSRVEHEVWLVKNEGYWVCVHSVDAISYVIFRSVCRFEMD